MTQNKLELNLNGCISFFLLFSGSSHLKESGCSYYARVRLQIRELIIGSEIADRESHEGYIYIYTQMYDGGMLSTIKMADVVQHF